MTLLDWLQSNHAVHVVSECFAVHEDIAAVPSRLPERSHLVPMSDASLFQLALGMTMGGSPVFLQWPTADVQGLYAQLRHLSTAPALTAALIIRVPVTEGTPDGLHDLAQFAKVYSVVHDRHRNELLDTALRTAGVTVLLESASGMAMDRLENRFTNLTGQSSTLFGDQKAHCTVLTPNYHLGLVDTVVSDSTHVNTLVLHDLSTLDHAAIESIRSAGRVVCVDLPKAWMSTLIQSAFWSLEAEPTFTIAESAAIHAAIQSVLED